MHAKVLAHAMKLSEYKRFEVWTGRTLVYERPMYLETNLAGVNSAAMP
jgi:hypothetical protein